MISMKHLLSVSCLLSGILLSAAPWSANSDFKQLDSPERTAVRKKGMLTRGIVFTGDQIPVKWSFARYGKKSPDIPVKFRQGALEINTGNDTLTLHNLRSLTIDRFKKAGTHRFYASGQGNVLVKCSLIQYDKAGKYISSVNLGAFRINARNSSAGITVEADKIKFAPDAVRAAPTFGLMGEGTLTELGIEIKNTHK